MVWCGVRAVLDIVISLCWSRLSVGILMMHAALVVHLIHTIRQAAPLALPPLPPAHFPLPSGHGHPPPSCTLIPFPPSSSGHGRPPAHGVSAAPSHQPQRPAGRVQGESACGKHAQRGRGGATAHTQEVLPDRGAGRWGGGHTSRLGRWGWACAAEWTALAFKHP